MEGEHDGFVVAMLRLKDKEALKNLQNKTTV